MLGSLAMLGSGCAAALLLTSLALQSCSLSSWVHLWVLIPVMVVLVIFTEPTCTFVFKNIVYL